MMTHPQEIMIKLVLDAWYTHIKRANNLFDLLTDEQMQNEVSPARNRGVYLLGHLTAVHDKMLPLLNFGEPLYPQLDEIFLLNPDKSFTEIPSIHDLKVYWKNVNETLAKNFETLQVNDWLQKHTAVTEEVFEKEPHRNRLNVVINRTNHLAYHLGQLVFLKNNKVSNSNQ